MNERLGRLVYLSVTKERLIRKGSGLALTKLVLYGILTVMNEVTTHLLRAKTKLSTSRGVRFIQ